ncbi:hypothetical protein NE237_028393 [Protea cynaroides]|uniref:Late embryogenesis abundant protein LEA-2 subgroup domain-containing protein n=1 Tax=Protea cynaroides TaxID=273540 RepID=A0A9Q0GPA7_9MAGN|nr:hypothetical protein NE237_028393 [Protea cynaroides]
MDSPKLSESEKIRRNLCLCLELIFGLLLLLVLILLILSFTACKPKTPIISVNWVSVEGDNVSIDLPLKAELNLTLLMDVSVMNPNKAGFKYGASSAWLYYRSQVVGEAPIRADDISAGETLEMIIPLTLMANQLLSVPNLYSDVISGTLELSTYTRLDVMNPNKAGFKYSGGLAWLYCTGQVVGQTLISANNISASGTYEMIIHLTANQLLSIPNLHSDVSTGMLPLSTYTRLDGKKHSKFHIKAERVAVFDFSFIPVDEIPHELGLKKSLKWIHLVYNKKIHHKFRQKLTHRQWGEIRAEGALRRNDMALVISETLY